MIAVLLAQAAVPDGIRIRDEGTTKGYADTIDCVGSAVTCSVSGKKATFTVAAGGTPGGSSGDLQTNNGAGGFGGYAGSGTCAAHNWFTALSTAGAKTCTQPAFTDISGTVAAAQLPTPTATTLGGVESKTCSGTDKLSAIGTDGVPVCSTDQTSAGAGYATIDEEAAALTQRTVLNFIGPAVTAADNAGATRTDVTVVASGTGACAAHAWASTLNNGAAPTCTQPDYADVSGTPTLFNQTIQEEGASVTQRATFNFIGPAITAADNAGSSRTDVTVVASGTGACAASTWASTLTNGAAPTCTQPNYSDLAGAANISRVTATGTATTCVSTGSPGTLVTSSAVTIPATGTYLVVAQAQLAPGASHTATFGLSKNGVALGSPVTVGATAFATAVTYGVSQVQVVAATASDTIDARCWDSTASGGTASAVVLAAVRLQ